MALGRSLDLGDRQTVADLQQDFIDHQYRLRHLILSLVTSELFLTK